VQDTFLPGILVKDGVIIIDRSKLSYPGDLLHEAGHIALEKAEDRPGLNDDIEGAKSESEKLEIGVILWSYAALKYLELPEEVVFHENGYKGDSNWLIEEYNKGNFIGLPLLIWMGLTYEKVTHISGEEIAPFPHMIKWLR